MPASDHSKVKEILKHISEKIQLLRKKATEVVNRKEVEAQIQQLEKHKKQIEEELQKANVSLQRRWKESQPHLTLALDELSKAFKALIGRTEEHSFSSTEVEKKKKKGPKHTTSSTKKKKSTLSRNSSASKSTTKRKSTKSS